MSEQSVVIAIVAVLVVFTLWVILRGRLPDVRRGARAETFAASDELSELELDRAMGRISEADYTRFRRELDARVEENSPPEPSSLDHATMGARERAEMLVRQWSAAQRPVCATCGQRPEPGARYCSTCGASLAPDRDA